MAQDQKVTLTDKLREFATMKAKTIQMAEDIHKVFFDRGFHKEGGSNPIVDTDIQAHTNLTEADVVAGITLCEQEMNFGNNLPVTQGDYKATINRLRKDF
jgi:hypothetical protein